MKTTYKGKWYEFTPEWSGFHLAYHLAGYFNSRPMLQIYFIWGKLFLYLPYYHYKEEIINDISIKEKRRQKLNNITGKKFEPKKIIKKVKYDECDPPRYGIYFHMNQLGINYGTKTKLYSLPWALDWVRTSCLKKNGEWMHETKKNKHYDFWDKQKWINVFFEETYPYKYVTKNGIIQNVMATITVIEREWRWKWFKWLKYTRKINKVIDINFNKEIGERAGSWKGGCLGCSYTMLKNEKPHETLKRMEKERKF